MENWQLYSLWNYRLARDIRNRGKHAVKALAYHYENLFKERNEDISFAPRAAQIVIEGLGPASIDKPPENDVRLAILQESDREKIAKNYNACNKSGKLSDSLPKVELIGKPDPVSFLAVNQPKILSLLFEHCGFNVLERNAFGKTLLMTAAHFNNLQNIKNIMLHVPKTKRHTYLNAVTNAPLRPEDRPPDNGYPYKPSITIKHGQRTALMYAAANASAGVIHYLLDQGADKCLKDSMGLTAKDYLVGNGPDNFINPSLTDKEIEDLTPLLSCRAKT